MGYLKTLYRETAAYRGLIVIVAFFIVAIVVAWIFAGPEMLGFGGILAERIAVITLLVYLFSTTATYRRLKANQASWTEKLAVAVFFGLISIYGTVRGMEVKFGPDLRYTASGNLRDVGPLIMGLIGGPLLGLISGIIGATHRYFYMDNATTLPCVIATLVAGPVAGFARDFWRGKLNYMKVGFLGAGLECFHMSIVFLFLPVAQAAGLMKTVAAPMILGASLSLLFMRAIISLHESAESRKKIDNELSIAHDIQMGIIPKIFPPFPEREEFSVFARLKPAKAVGGDLYDFFIVDDETLTFALGDVSGKGVPASLFMAVTLTLLRSHGVRGGDIGDIVTTMNKHLCVENDLSMFVTFFIGSLRFKTGELTYCNAGHNPPYIIRRSNNVLEKLTARHGMPLGVMELGPYKSDTTVLAPGDALVVYSDGVTEAIDDYGRLFEEKRLEDILERFFDGGKTDYPAREITDAVYSGVSRFVGDAEQSDDITVLALTYCHKRPAATSPSSPA